jgi:glycogen(starch) synthase
MRIALAASSYAPRIGGVEEHVFSLARELQSGGDEVVVWTVDQGASPAQIPDGVTVRSLPCPLPNRSIRGLVHWLASATGAARAWRNALRTDQPDVINIQCYGANGPWAARLARGYGVPLVYSNHGETFMDAQRAFESTLLRRSLGSTLRTAAAITSCSAFAAADLARFGGHSPATIVGNGVDSALAPAPIGSPLPTRRIVGVGRLVRNKGFDTLISAFARASSRTGLEDVTLVLAGDGPERPALESLAREHGLGDRVRFLGGLTRDQVVGLLDGALMQVVPSHVEAFGIVVLEGWRAGVPVVVTSNGGPSEFVRDRRDGVLFDPCNETALADILARLVDDPAERVQLGSTGRARLPAYTWSAVADRYRSVFRSVTTSHPDRSGV